MQLVTTPAIVLRTTRYGDTSLILDLLTEKLGRQAYILNGVRSARSKVPPALLQVMAQVEVVAYHHPNARRTIERIREIRATYLYQRVPFEIQRSAVGSLLVEVASRVIRDENPCPDLYQLLTNALIVLDQLPYGYANLHLYYLIQLAGYLGFGPQGRYHPDHAPYFDLREGLFCGTPPAGHGHYLAAPEAVWWSYLLHGSVEEVAAMSLAASDRRHLLDRCLLYYRLHIDNMPELASVHIWQDVFSA